MSKEKGELKRSSQATLMRTLETLTLLNNRFGITIDELYRHFVSNYGEKFAPSIRTIYRYILSLEAANFYIENNKGRYKVHLNHSELDFGKLLQCTKEESNILAKAINLVEGDSEIKQKLAQKLSSLADTEGVHTEKSKEIYAQNVIDLSQAITNNNQVILLQYRSANGKTIRDRKVEPFGFTFRRAYIWAFDTEDKKNKLFSTSRFSGITVLNNKFQYSNQHKTGETDIFGIAGYEPKKIQLKLSMRAYNLLVEEFPLAEKEIEALGNGDYLLTTKVCGFNGVGRFIMGLPGEVTIMSPVTLKSFVKEQINSLII